MGLRSLKNIIKIMNDKYLHMNYLLPLWLFVWRAFSSHWHVDTVDRSVHSSITDVAFEYPTSLFDNQRFSSIPNIAFHIGCLV